MKRSADHTGEEWRKNVSTHRSVLCRPLRAWSSRTNDSGFCWLVVNVENSALNRPRIWSKSVRSGQLTPHIRQSATVIEYSVVHCARAAQHSMAQHFTGSSCTLQYYYTMPICTKTCHPHKRLPPRCRGSSGKSSKQ